MSITFLRGKFSSAASLIWIRRRTGGGQDKNRDRPGGGRRRGGEDPFADRAHRGRGEIPEVLHIPLEGREQPIPRKSRVGEGRRRGAVLPGDRGDVHLVEDSA